MVEFLLEHDGKTYSGSYRVDDELAITVTIANQERRTPLIEMRPAAEAIAIARQLLEAAALPVGSAADEPASGNRNLETARALPLEETHDAGAEAKEPQTLHRAPGPKRLDDEMNTLAKLMSRLAGKTRQFLAEIFDEDSPDYESRMEEERAQKQRTRISWSKNLNNLS